MLKAVPFPLYMEKCLPVVAEVKNISFVELIIGLEKVCIFEKKNYSNQSQIMCLEVAKKNVHIYESML